MPEKEDRLLFKGGEREHNGKRNFFFTGVGGRI